MGECKWLLPDCHQGTWFTLSRRWQAWYQPIGLSLERMFRDYCAVFDPRTHTKRSVWVRALRPSNDPPEGWPSTARWSRHLPMWKRIYRRAEAFQRGELRDKCKGRPVHTGGRIIDGARMVAALWRKVDCGETGDQWFWELRR